MQYRPKLMDMDEDVVVIVEEIPNTIVFMATIHQILKKGKPHRNHENNFYRCGMKRHWLRTCRTLKHLVDLYQTLIKAKGKKIDMNFINSDGLDLTYYDIDFFGGPIEKTYYLINDEKINIDKCYFIYQII